MNEIQLEDQISYTIYEYPTFAESITKFDPSQILFKRSFASKELAVCENHPISHSSVSSRDVSVSGSIAVTGGIDTSGSAKDGSPGGGFSA